MFTFIIKRQESNRETTIRDLSKKFQRPVADLVAMLAAQPFDGYSVVLHTNGKPADGKTVVEIFEKGLPSSPAGIYAQPEPAPVADDAHLYEQTPEEAALTEAIAEQMAQVEAEPVATDGEPKPAAKSRAYIPGTYVDYTEEAAKEQFPEGWLSVAEMHKFFVAQRIPVSRMVRAIGGDRMVKPPKNEVWTPFTISGHSKRYLSRLALDEVEAMRQK